MNVSAGQDTSDGVLGSCVVCYGPVRRTMRGLVCRTCCRECARLLKACGRLLDPERDRVWRLAHARAKLRAGQDVAWTRGVIERDGRLARPGRIWVVVGSEVEKAWDRVQELRREGRGEGEK